MPPETAPTASTATVEDVDWRPGIVAGLAAGAVMGVMLTMQMTPVITKAIPAMYAQTGLLAGWIAHLFHGAVLGLVFVFAVNALGQTDRASTPGGGLGLGIGYGIALWVVLAALVMPVWLSSVGFPNAPALPNFNPMSLVGHVVYGAVLGGVYSVLAN